MIRYPGNDLDLGTILGCPDSMPGRQLMLSRRDRARHTYIVGATRTGKSKAMENMVRQDIMNWPRSRCPVFVLDPHGTLFDGLMEYVAANNLRRPIIPIDLRRRDLVFSYNLMKRREGLDAPVAARSFAQAILHAWGQSNSNLTPRLIGWLETLLTLAYEMDCSLVQALELIRNPQLRHAVTGNVQHLVARAMLETAAMLREPEFQERVESTLYRLNRFLGTQLIRATLCQGGTSLDLSQVLEEGSIVLVTTSTQGTQIAEEDAITFGSLLVTDLWQAARRRGKREEGALRPCYCYVDEFQNFISPAIAKGLAEASGMGLHLTLANQFPSQLADQGEMGLSVLNSVMANARNKIVFQLSHPKDLELLSLAMFRQHIDPDAVKQEIHSTKVMDHAIKYMASKTSGKSVGTSHETNWSQSETQSRSQTEQWSHTDAVNHSVGWSENFSEGDSDSAGVSDNTGESTGKSRSEQESSSRGSQTSTGNSAAHNETEGFGLSGQIDEKGSILSGPSFQQTYNDPGEAQQAWNRSASDSTGRSNSAGTNESRGHSSGLSESRQMSRSRGQSRSQTKSLSHGISVSEGFSETSSDTYGESETVGESYGTSEGGSKGRSEGSSESVSLSPMQMPIMGKELSSRQYISIDEQLFKVTKLLDGLPDRTCMVRIASMQQAVKLFTHTVKKPLATLRWTHDFTLHILQQLPFVTTMAQAMQQLVDRERNFAQGIMAAAVDEQPAAARRVVRRLS